MDLVTAYDQTTLSDVAKKLSLSAEAKSAFRKAFKFLALEDFAAKGLLQLKENHHSLVDWPAQSVRDIIEIKLDEEVCRFVVLEDEFRKITQAIIEHKNESIKLAPFYRKDWIDANTAQPPIWKVGDVHEGRGVVYVVVWQHAEHAILWGGHDLKFQLAHATTWEEGYEDWVNAVPDESEFSTFNEAHAAYLSL